MITEKDIKIEDVKGGKAIDPKIVAKNLKTKLLKKGIRSLSSIEKVILKFDSDFNACMKSNRRISRDLNEYKAKSKQEMKALSEGVQKELARRRAWEEVNKKKIDDLHAREKKRQICKKRKYLPNCKEYQPLLEIILEDCRQVGYCDLKSKDLRILLAHKTGSLVTLQKIDHLISGMLANEDLIRPEKAVYERNVGRKGLIRRLFAGVK